MYICMCVCKIPSNIKVQLVKHIVQSSTLHSYLFIK